MSETATSLLREARRQLPGREGDWLLMHVTGADRATLQHDGDRPLTAEVTATFRRLVQRRLDGTPLAYLLGSQPFRTLELMVDGRVLIPRPETEELVERALTRHPADAPVRALDLGTGSGAIALAMAAERPHWMISAVEASRDALAVAQANGERLQLRVHWRAGDWFAPLTAQTFELIVSNPPYVAEQDPELAAEVAIHEPPAALRAGADGLDAIRIIAADAPRHLRPGGWLVLEHGYRQGGAVREALRKAGFTAVETTHDSQRQERFTEGRYERKSADG